MEALVSIVIPAYNAAQYIGEAVESVLQQTHRNFELIICNDGSTDDTLKIVSGFQKKDRRISVLNFRNVGRAAAFNKGAAVSQGEFIAGMDADDVMLPHRIEKQVQFLLHNPDVHGVSCFAYYVGPTGKTFGSFISKLTTVEDCRRIRENQEYTVPLNTGFTTRRQPFLAIGGYNEKMETGDDVEMFNRYIDCGYNVVSIPEFLMKYRIHGSSTMFKNFVKNAIYVEYIKKCMALRRAGLPEITFEEFRQIDDQKPWLKKMHRLRKIYSSMLYRNSGYYYATKDYIKFILSLGASLVLDPVLNSEKVMRQLRLKYLA